jgi:NitT/TauT family transport system ATP-binding protein
MVGTPPYEYRNDGVILHIEGVNLAFGEKGEHVILRDVNARIENIVRPNMQQGQIRALLGPSGVGKTQLFRLMAGLDIPGAKTSGKITIGENQVPVRAGIVGVVSQHYPLFMHRKVIDNLVLPGRKVGLSKEAAQEKAMALLTSFGMADRADHWPAQLSGGQRQRIAIAQQLMCSEHVVLMDEPFSGLDPLMVDKVSELIQEISRLDEYNTTVVVTHEISAAVAIADHIMVMGRDRTPEGEIIPGAYIKKEFNLIDMGLAWRPDIRKLPRFRDFCAELRDLFHEL